MGGTLDDARVKRIGFGADVTRSLILIERTLAEVAGTYDCHNPRSRLQPPQDESNLTYPSAWHT